MAEGLPAYSDVKSPVFEGGRRTAGTNYHTGSNEIGTELVNILGKDSLTGQPSPLESTNGGLLVSDSGFYPDTVNFIYYVRSSDYALYQGPNRLYVDDSLGRHKKIVTFKNGADPNDLAQITIIYYQIAAFPTKITSLQTFYDKVQYYLQGGVGDPFYDHNSAPQQSIVPNP